MLKGRTEDGLRVGASPSNTTSSRKTPLQTKRSADVVDSRKRVSELKKKKEKKKEKKVRQNRWTVFGEASLASKQASKQVANN